MAKPTSENPQRGLTPVILEPKTLVMMGATALTTALTLNFWVPVAGVAGIGLLVWSNLRARSQEQAEQALEAQYGVADPALPEGVEPEYRGRIQAIVEAQRKLLHEIRDSNDLVRQMMDPTLPAIRELGGKYAALTLKLRELTAYLDSARLPQLEKDIASLGARLKATTDEVTAQGLQHALAAKEERLKVSVDLKVGVERIRAHLESIEAALEKFHGQVVKMKSAEARRVSLETEDVSQAVNTLNQDVDALASGIERTFTNEF